MSAYFLKHHLKKNYQGYEKDLFSAFMIRDLQLTKESGQLGFMSPFVWMFISSYENLRAHFIDQATITSLIQLEYSGFDGATVPICTFTLAKAHIKGFTGSYIRLSDFRGSENQAPKTLEAINNPSCGWFFNAKPDDFKKIPGSPIAYWMPENLKNIFKVSEKLGDIAPVKKGLVTSDNNRFLRTWYEVNIGKTNFTCDSRKTSYTCGAKWFPINSGGEFRKWYGNNETLINWELDGKEIIEYNADLYGSASRQIQNTQYYFKEALTWSNITSGRFGIRATGKGYIFGCAGTVALPKEGDFYYIAALLNSHIANYLLQIFNPTLNFVVANIASLAVVTLPNYKINITDNTKPLIHFAKTNWDSYETSWDFSLNPIICTQQPNLEQAFNSWQQQNADAVAEMKRLEEENNKLFIDAYGLQDELTPDVPDEQITLTRANREKDSQRLVSYAIGCMMGRYNLDEPGLIYAHAGNQDFDASRYQTFPADADGIIPLTEMHWFEDDATHRIQEFLTAVWGKDTLDANMQWLAESLDKKANETAEDTIRRYLASKFYKDHMQTYKKRPIYWLFSSGKQGAFQALVYLHRYNESTLARMRTEYVMPLISKMAAYANSLETAKESSDSTAEIQRIEKKLQDLHKQQAELSSFEEKLRHYADQRITLDLDDGVKVNYGKFGDLLAEVKAVTGEK